ncbi:MAG: hypothetical protein IT459_10430, partial [Planctomycetes bacterium]|nr:hypothetical protein [Planctomycetota bacterium]
MHSRSIQGLALLLCASAFAGSQNLTDGDGAPSGWYPVQAALDDWRAEHGVAWQVRFDDQAGYARFVFGGSAPSALRPRDDADWFSAARAAVAATKALHGVDTHGLVEERVVFLPLSHAGSSDKMTVQFRQAKDGVPVLDGCTDV